MQIHELNNFSGTLGAGAYLAIDDGTDTGKISSQGLLAATEARIDNIIAGPAPSAEEIVDARLGADGVTYPSLGDAIRDQFTDVKDDLNKSFDTHYTPNLLDSSAVSDGYIRSGGNLTVAGDWKTTDYIPVEYGSIYSYSVNTISTNVRKKETIFFRLEYDENKNIISGSYAETGTQSYTPSALTVKYIRFSVHWKDTENDWCFVQGASIEYSVYGETSFTLKTGANTESVQKIISAATIVNARNLFDKNNITEGYISNASGDITVYSDWITTDYIPVEYGKNYSCSNESGKLAVYFALELDATQSPINYINAAAEPYTPTASTVKYIRFCQHSGNIATMTFEQSSQISCIYTPYGYNLISAYHSTLYGKKWVAVGDSLTERNATAISNYTDFISVQNNMEIVNMGVGGTGYMRGYDESIAFYQRVSDIPSCDIITIFGSGNDLALYSDLGDVTDSTTDTICGCINETLDVIFANHPTTPLLVIAPTPWEGNTPDLTTGMALYCEKLSTICSRRGVAYLDLFHHSGLRPNDATQRDLVYYADGVYVHPNKLGQSIIAPRIMQAMESICIF